MADQVWVTRVLGLGPDGAEVIRREVPYTNVGQDFEQVRKVSTWVESLIQVETVREERRRYY